MPSPVLISCTCKGIEIPTIIDRKGIEIPTIIDLSATINYPSAAGSIIVGITVYVHIMCSEINVYMCACVLVHSKQVCTHH